MPPKAAPKKTTTTKGPAKAPAKGAGATKTGATKGAPASKGAAGGATGGAAKEPEKKPEPKPIKKVLVPEEIDLKDIAKVWGYEGDVGVKYKDSKRWLYLIDRHDGMVATFLKYRDTNIIYATSLFDFDSETIRRAIMGSLRFGKPCIVNICDSTDQEGILKLLVEKVNTICDHLYEDIMDRSILEFEKCSRMCRDSDDGEYQNRYDYRTSDFQFVILTNVDPPSTAVEDFFPVIIKKPVP